MSHSVPVTLNQKLQDHVRWAWYKQLRVVGTVSTGGLQAPCKGSSHSSDILSWCHTAVCLDGLIYQWF